MCCQIENYIVNTYIRTWGKLTKVFCLCDTACTLRIITWMLVQLNSLSISGLGEMALFAVLLRQLSVTLTQWKGHKHNTLTKIHHHNKHLCTKITQYSVNSDNVGCV